MRKILPHVMQQLREGNINLDIEVITEHDGVAEVCAKRGGLDLDLLWT